MFIVYINKLIRSDFIRSVFIVATGTAGAQAITMIFSPVITRLYSPEEFGLLGAFMAMVAVLTPMAALTYPIAIVLPRKHEDAIGLVKLSIRLAIVISSFVMIVVFFWGRDITDLLNASKMYPYLWLISVAMFFSVLHQVAEQWLIRHQQFRVAARVSVVQSGLVNVIKAGAGFYYPIGGVLITIQILSQGVWALLLFLGIKGNKCQPLYINDNTKASLRELAYRYRDFAIFRAPEVSINAASQSLPVLMLAAVFGPESAGFYTLALTIMGVPAALIGKSVGDVFYPRISEASNSGEKLYPLLKKATLLMAIVGFFPFAVVMIFGPWLFALVFGAEWLVAGEYARWLAVWMFFGFANNPCIKVIPIVNAQAFHLLWTVFTIMLRLGSLFFAYFLFESAVLTIIAFSIIGALVNIVLIFIVLNKCKRNDMERS